MIKYQEEITKTPDHRNENEDERCDCSISEYGKGKCLIIFQYFHIYLILPGCNIPIAIIRFPGYGPQQCCREEEEVGEGDQKTGR